MRTTVVVLCVLASALCISAQTDKVFTTFSEWPVPAAASEPLYMSASGNNGVYFAEQFAGKFGFLDTNTNVFTEWTLAAGSQPVNAAPQGQNVAFAEENGHVALLATDTAILTEWSVPVILGTSSQPFGAAYTGNFIFFTDYLQGVIGMVNTSNDEITLWPMPGAPDRRPNQMVLSGPASNPQVWVADSLGKISMLETATGVFTEWTVPSEGLRPVLQNLSIAADGSVAFQDFVNAKIGVLNPASNLIREWAVPTSNASPVNVAFLSLSLLAFAEESANRIGTMDLRVAPLDLEQAVAPEITVVSPEVLVAAPTFTVPFQTRTLVPPLITGVDRLISGGFDEYPIPTPLSGPVGLSVNSNGAILFTESSANKIGLLQ